MCFDPKKPIAQGASEVNGLDEDLIFGQTPFRTYHGSLLNMWLRHLPGPVLVLAYNGFKFDFPLLQAELKAADKSLRSDVWIADPLIRIR